MKDKNFLVQQILTFLFWFVFIGACLHTGAIIISYLVVIFKGHDSFHILDYDLSPLLYNKTVAFFFIVLLVAFGMIKCFMIYQILQLFSLLKIADPFHRQLSRLLIKIARLALYCCGAAIALKVFCVVLEKQNVLMDKSPYDEGAFLLFAGFIYIIALVFQKGEALQTENELTV